MLLAALAMIGPFTVDTYLPSFPAIQRDLKVSAVQMQQTLSVYLLTFAVMTLFHGTLSDSFGRILSASNRQQAELALRFVW